MTNTYLPVETGDYTCRTPKMGWSERWASHERSVAPELAVPQKGDPTNNSLKSHI